MASDGSVSRGHESHANTTMYVSLAIRYTKYIQGGVRMTLSSAPRQHQPREEPAVERLPPPGPQARRHDPGHAGRRPQPDVHRRGAEVQAELRPALRQHLPGEKDAKLAQKLGQLQPFRTVFPEECMGQLASFGPT